MTPDERVAANRRVAEWAGGRLAETTVNGRPLWYIPPATIPQLCDLWADTPEGAQWREQVEERLVVDGFSFELRFDSGCWSVIVHHCLMGSDWTRIQGETSTEARANAFYAAICALRGEKG